MGEEVPGNYQDSILRSIQKDRFAAEFQLALFSTALLSYRKDSCLRPFPEFLQKECGTKDIERLETLWSQIPSLDDLIASKNILSDEVWKLLHWILLNRIFSTKTCDKSMVKDLEAKTGQSSFILQPDYIFEVSYTTNASQTFDERSKQYGVKYGYHGSRMDNFYSIVSNGLQVHMMKNGLFGDGIYLCEDLAVTMPYVSGGKLWKHSKLGEQASCVAVCELLDHPGVKRQIEDNKGSKSRSTARNSQLGEVPEKYFVVTSSDLVRIKYMLVFMDKRAPKRSTANRSWICFRYPVASILSIYFFFLLLMGVWKTRMVQLYYRKHWRFDNDEED